MAQTRRDEERLLTSDEHGIVAHTHHPALGTISDADLSDLVKRLRDRRDRAQDIARQQRREMRGKAAPAGARAATDNSGTKEKGALLSAALKRANKEGTRRRRRTPKPNSLGNAERALKMAQACGENENRPERQVPSLFKSKPPSLRAA